MVASVNPTTKPGELIISDSNWRQFASLPPGQEYAPPSLNPVLRHGSTGYLGWQRPGSPRKMYGKRPSPELIPRNEWIPRIQAMQDNLLTDLLMKNNVKAMDQDGLGYCWVYGSTFAEMVRRLLHGLPWKDLAPESVGGPLTNWRNEGGYAAEAFGGLETAGACEASFLDKPNSLHYRNWKEGWQENALNYRVQDWYDLETSDNLEPPATCFDEVITCLLMKLPVAAGLDWWGHLICFLDPVILPDGTVGVRFINSWGVDWPTPGANGYACLTESRGTPDGAACPVSSAISETATDVKLANAV
jgi:hypothetical protein